MKKYFILLLSIIFIQCAATRTTHVYDAYTTKDYLYWSEDRKLSWSDFLGTPIEQDNIACEALFIIPSSAGQASLFAKKEITAICVFDKKRSWVNKRNSSDNLLLYNQVVFDMYELYARKLRKEFMETRLNVEDIAEEYHRINEKNNSLLMNEVQQFRRASKLGEVPSVVKEWSIKIKERLTDLNKYKVIYTQPK